MRPINLASTMSMARPICMIYHQGNPAELLEEGLDTNLFKQCPWDITYNNVKIDATSKHPIILQTTPNSEGIDSNLQLSQKSSFTMPTPVQNGYNGITPYDYQLELRINAWGEYMGSPEIRILADEITAPYYLPLNKLPYKMLDGGINITPYIVPLYKITFNGVSNFNYIQLFGKDGCLHPAFYSSYLEEQYGDGFPEVLGYINPVLGYAIVPGHYTTKLSLTYNRDGYDATFVFPNGATYKHISGYINETNYFEIEHTGETVDFYPLSVMYDDENIENPTVYCPNGILPITVTEHKIQYLTFPEGKAQVILNSSDPNDTLHYYNTGDKIYAGDKLHIDLTAIEDEYGYVYDSMYLNGTKHNPGQDYTVPANTNVDIAVKYKREPITLTDTKTVGLYDSTKTIHLFLGQTDLWPYDSCTGTVTLKIGYQDSSGVGYKTVTRDLNELLGKTSTVDNAKVTLTTNTLHTTIQLQTANNYVNNGMYWIQEISITASSLEDYHTWKGTTYGGVTME